MKSRALSLSTYIFPGLALLFFFFSLSLSLWLVPLFRGAPPSDTVGQMSEEALPSQPQIVSNAPQGEPAYSDKSRKTKGPPLLGSSPFYKAHPRQFQPPSGRGENFKISRNHWRFMPACVWAFGAGGAPNHDILK